MKQSILYNILLMALFAFLANSFVYFGFGNIYSSKIFNHADFLKQFNTGIYQYRVLSGQLLLHIYDILDGLNINYDVFKLKFYEQRAEAQMYIALYLLNTFFAVLTAVGLGTILHSSFVKGSHHEKLTIGLLVVAVTTLTQFVIVPYDYSSYFFILLFAGVFLLHLKRATTATWITLAAIVVLSTLNRESSALSLSMAGALLVQYFGWSKKTFLTVGVLAGCYIATYIILRLTGNSNFTTNDGNLFYENMTQPKNWLGAMFAVLLFLVTLKLSTSKENIKLILLFHALAIPYIAMCLYSGILYEVRLYIPLFLTSVLLGKLDTKTINSNI